MDVFEAIKQRASVRAFVPCEISEQELEQVVDAGRRAPSGYNRQPWQFIVVRDPEVLNQLGRIQKCIADASAAIAVVLDEGSTNFAREDAAAAIENMLLALVSLGYSSLWVEGYVLRHEQYGKQVLGVPDNLRLLAILPIGRPAEEVRQAEKRPLGEITHRDRYGRRW
jgi:nitroreductase